MIESDAIIRNGENPSFTICFIFSIDNSSLWSLIFDLNLKKQNTNIQDKNCATTVPMAAPATPILSVRIKIKSKTIFVMAPIHTLNIAIVA